MSHFKMNKSKRPAFMAWWRANRRNLGFYRFQRADQQAVYDIARRAFVAGSHFEHNKASAEPTDERTDGNDLWSRCSPLVEDEQAWESFLEDATEEQAYRAIDGMLNLASRLRMRSIPHAHVEQRIETGYTIYERRFGRPWLPF